jgi:predicted Zn-dependent peptidase
MFALRVGSRDETYDNRGISHMMRTLVGTATENFSAFGITTGSLPSITETQEFVVPKSIPIILLITE